MESHEVMRSAVSELGSKSVASDMSLSPSLIYKWCESKDGGAAGADNPLDRILRFCQITGDPAPVIWLCEQMDAFCVANPTPATKGEELEMLAMTRKILKEFSEMLEVMSQAIADDGKVDREESLRIRNEWEDLKRTAEQFVLACETGRNQ